jgi:hypothetical protein
MTSISDTLHEDRYIFLITSGSLLRMRVVSDESFSEKRNTNFVQWLFFSPENLAFYKIMCKNIVERGRPQMVILRMLIACWIPKATNTHSEYVILLAFPPQHRLKESTSVLRYTTLPVWLQSSKYISVSKLLPDVRVFTAMTVTCVISCDVAKCTLVQSGRNVQTWQWNLLQFICRLDTWCLIRVAKTSISLFQTAWRRIPGVCYLPVISTMLTTVIVTSCLTQKILSSGFSLSVGMRFRTYTLWLLCHGPSILRSGFCMYFEKIGVYPYLFGGVILTRYINMFADG